MTAPETTDLSTLAVTTRERRMLADGLTALLPFADRLDHDTGDVLALWARVQPEEAGT